MIPWLTLIGLGEDGLDGLPEASRIALAEAELVFGGARHLALAQAGDRGRPWTVPFSVEPVIACRGRRIAVLASGDPFWFGVGGTLARHLSPDEWQAFPAPSTFTLIAARLGWRIEETHCLGLHAQPLEELVPHLARDTKAICLVRDGKAVGEVAAWLSNRGFGESRIVAFERVGGPHERRRDGLAREMGSDEFEAPVAVALYLNGGPGLPRASGLADDLFRHDGQITKRPVRALTLSALAPRRGERLWDIGAGSGSVAIEWLLATGPRGRAIAIEPRSDRADNVRENARAFGVSGRLDIVEGTAPAALAGLEPPDAVFIGGGASEELLVGLWRRLPAGTRLVVNAVTLETEALLMDWSARAGGELLRIELAGTAPLGNRRGWSQARPILQWSTVR